MTTKQMSDWDDGTVGFQCVRQVGASELRDAVVVHPAQGDAADWRIVEFSTELHYGGGATQRSESSITLNPQQAATFAQAMSAPRLGGIAEQQAPVRHYTGGRFLRYIDAPAGSSIEYYSDDRAAITVENPFEAIAAGLRGELDEIIATLPAPPVDLPLVEQFRRMAADAELYRKLRGMHWNDKKLAVVEASDLKLGVRSYSREFLDQAIRKHAP